MKFPAANVSISHWNKDEDYLLYVLENEFIYNPDNELYQKYFLNNLFVDSNGDIYKLIDRKLPSKIIQLFSFIPNLCKVEFIFKKTEEKMTLEQVRQHLLNQIEQLADNENKVVWLHTIKNANTFEEIIFG